MPEGGGDEAVAGRPEAPAPPTANHARAGVEVGDGGLHRLVVRLLNCSGDRLVAEPPKEGDGLRRGEREVIPRSGEPSADPLPGPRVTAGKQRLQVLGSNLAHETDLGRGRTDPPAR